MQNYPLEKRANDPTLKAILICQNYLNILTIEGKLKNNSVFTFFLITLEDMLKEIGHFDISKSSQNTDVSTKIIKENLDVFSPFKNENFNNMIDLLIFAATLNLASITPVFLKKFQKSEGNL